MDSLDIQRAGSRSAARRARRVLRRSAGRAGSNWRLRLATVARADDAAPPARPRGAARAALPCPQDPRPRALPLLMMTPIPLTSYARPSATPPPTGARRRRRRAPKLDRPPSPTSATTPATRRCCSRRCSETPPRGDRRAPRARRSSERLGDDRGACRGGRPGVPEPVHEPTRWYLDALAERAGGRRALRRGRRATPASA